MACPRCMKHDHRLLFARHEAALQAAPCMQNSFQAAANGNAMLVATFGGTTRPAGVPATAAAAAAAAVMSHQHVSLAFVARED